MYLRYAERRGWKTELLDAQESDLGGYKDVSVAVKARGTPKPGEAPFARLKYEGGVHRVQRVPATESQGRIHTSAAGVLVLPEAEDVDVDDRPERPADRRLPLVRPRRPERQHHRLRRADHPRARPASSSPARTRSRSCRTRSRRMRILRATAARRRAGGGGRGRLGRTPLARSARSTAPSGCAPTTSRRTGSATTGSATRPTTSTACSTATSTASCRRWSTPTSTRRLQ